MVAKKDEGKIGCKEAFGVEPIPIVVELKLQKKDGG